MKGKLRWRCRRGMRELDAVLEAFLEHGYDSLDDADKSRFETVLSLPDPQLHGYLLGRHEADQPDLARLLALIRAAARRET